MVKNRLGICALAFALAAGLMGAAPAFGIWPFSSEEESALIDINTADQATLAALPDVGEARARAIVDYRQQHGPFKTVEEMKQVPSIGEQVFANIKEKITVGEGAQAPSKESSAQSQTTATMGEEEK